MLEFNLLKVTCTGTISLHCGMSYSSTAAAVLAQQPVEHFLHFKPNLFLNLTPQTVIKFSKV